MKPTNSEARPRQPSTAKSHLPTQRRCHRGRPRMDGGLTDRRRAGPVTHRSRHERRASRHYISEMMHHPRHVRRNHLSPNRSMDLSALRATDEPSIIYQQPGSCTGEPMVNRWYDAPPAPRATSESSTMSEMMHPPRHVRRYHLSPHWWMDLSASRATDKPSMSRHEPLPCAQHCGPPHCHPQSVHSKRLQQHYAKLFSISFCPHTRRWNNNCNI